MLCSKQSPLGAGAACQLVEILCYLLAVCQARAPFLQAGYLQELNRRADPEAAIRLFESGQVATTEASTGEYVKALVKVDRLDSSALLRTLQVFDSCFLHGKQAASLQSIREQEIPSFQSQTRQQQALLTLLNFVVLQSDCSQEGLSAQAHAKAELRK